MPVTPTHLRWPLLAMLAGLLTAPTAAQPGCQATTPADLPGVGRWLGDCPGGRAEGLGALRVGTNEPYGFFLGRMHGGRPVTGMIRLADGGAMAGKTFDAKGRAVSPDGLHPNEFHHLYLLASEAARVTARRFAAGGNQGSASYYARLAKQITDEEPE